MSDRSAALRALQERAENDEALRTELLAAPLAVTARETGIPVAELNELMSEAELKTIAGGLAPKVPAGDRTYYCNDGDYQTRYILELVNHRFDVHGKKVFPG